MAALVDLTGGLAERYELKGADPSMYRHLLRAHKSGAFIACSRKVGRTKLSRWFLLSLAFSLVHSLGLSSRLPFLCFPVCVLPQSLSPLNLSPLSLIFILFRYVSLCFSFCSFHFLSLCFSLTVSLYVFFSHSLSLSLSLYIYIIVYIFSIYTIYYKSVSPCFSSFLSHPLTLSHSPSLSGFLTVSPSDFCSLFLSPYHHTVVSIG